MKYKKETRILTLLLALILSGVLSGCGKSVPHETSGGNDVVHTVPDETVKAETENALTALVDTMEPLAVSPSAPTLPENNTVFSPVLAREALALCSGNEAGKQKSLFEAAGFTVLLQKHYDKADDDPAHSCAYAVGKKTVTYRGQERSLLLVAIRGTNAGEWYSNFDFAPSHSDDAVFAENYLFAAEDVFLGLQGLIDTAEEPLILVCGHSRGAACANLLGVLLNAAYVPGNCFIYTFATPATARGGDMGTVTDNIFNVINPCDLVPAVPLAAWGYTRPGTDILLSSDSEKAARVADITDTLADIAPTVSRYYADRHSLTSPGLSENGLTAFELMLTFTALLTGADSGDSAASLPDGLNTGDSDFAPLLDLLTSATENGNAGAASVLREHLPDTYDTLLGILQ